MPGGPTTKDHPSTFDSRSKPRGRGVDPQTPRQYQLVGGSDHEIQPNEESKISLLGIPGGDVEISGGQFNAVGGNQFRLQVNVNGNPSEGCRKCSAVSVGSTGAHTDDADAQGVEGPRSGAAAPCRMNDSVSSLGEDPELVRRPTRSQHQVETEAPNDIYYRCLATQKRGSPLWIPEPNKQLSVEYQRNGLVIGDVGIITEEGCFDSLFNISLPPDHPLSINSNELPQNFTPLEIKPGHIFKSSKFKKGAFLSSGSVLFVTKDDSARLIFESSASEGAILTLPDGSNSEDLRNKKRLHDYLAVHLEDIYRCALIDHGRMIDNGDLRVVTGIDKTMSWGMAAFLNPSSQAKSTFHLEFRPGDQGAKTQTHSWKTNGTADVKVGPDTREVVDLRRNEPSQQDVEYENQAVFVRTENPTLNPRVWEALLKESGALAGNPRQEGDPDPPSDSPSSPSGTFDASPHSAGNSTTRDVSCRSANCDSWSCSISSPNTLTVHPAHGINEMLLKLNPTARMAITGDDVWISVLREDDEILPCPVTFCTRVMASYDVCLQNDVVFLTKTKTEVLPAIDGDPFTGFVSETLTTISPDSNRQTCPPSASTMSVNIQSDPCMSDIRIKPRPRIGLGNELDQTVSDPTHSVPDGDSRLRRRTLKRSWVTQTDDDLKIPVMPSSMEPSPSKKRRLEESPDTSLDTPQHKLPRTAPRMFSSSLTTTTLKSVGGQECNLEDIGVVSTTVDRGPSSDSLLTRDRQEFPSSPEFQSHLPPDSDFVVLHSVDISSPQFPALKPLINRSTLKELELDVILRNPVIRHDLLLDPTLQFRPRRKREKLENYWNAVWEEVQTGCTCLTVDTLGNLHHPKICICSRSSSSSSSSQYTMAEQYLAKDGNLLFSIRLPSRIPALLTELLEVMVFVIQPLSNTAVYTDPNAIREQAQEHSAHAAYLRSIFDPALIIQELHHKLFDPSGLFAQIGQTLKHHCAPMRDRAVEEMVQMAQRPAPEAFKAVRACLELLELMKVDIANYQLTQLRPWLLSKTGSFEVKAFKNRFGTKPSLHNTRQWLYDAHDALLKRKAPFPKPSTPSECIKYSEFTKNDQIYMSVLKGIVDLIFSIQQTQSFSPLMSGGNTHKSGSLDSSHVSSNLVSLPETLYLDESQLLHFSRGAISMTKVYMFILLFRQLVRPEHDLSSFSHPYCRPNITKVKHDDITWIKHEIQVIGSSFLRRSGLEVHLEAKDRGMGMCFSLSPSTPVQESDNDKLEDDEDMDEIQGILIQIMRRVTDIRKCRPSSATSNAHSEALPKSLLSIAQRWVNNNIRTCSPLTILVHNRLRDAVFDVLVSMAPGRDACYAERSFGADCTVNDLHRDATKVTRLAGLEIMTDEIQELTKQISRLAVIHLNTHLPLYQETSNFPRFQESEIYSGHPMNSFCFPIDDMSPLSGLA